MYVDEMTIYELYLDKMPVGTTFVAKCLDELPLHEMYIDEMSIDKIQ